MLRRHFIILTHYTDGFILDNAKLTAIAFNAPDRLFAIGKQGESNGGDNRGSVGGVPVRKVNTDDEAEVAGVLIAINGGR